MSINLRSAFPLDEFRAGADLVLSLPRYLRHPVDPARGRAVLRRRLERRTDDFLDLARRTIFARPTSPYNALMRAAGCELGDLVRMVRVDGLEGALRTLYERGVYLTVEEFKGRRPTVRGSTSLSFDVGELRNPLASWHIMTHSSGSRGARTPIPIDLANVRDRAVNAGLHMDARGGSDWVYGIWGFPGGWPLNRILQYDFHAHRGNPIVRWFMMSDESASSTLRSRYAATAYALHVAGKIARVPIPLPEPVMIDDPLPVARWVSNVLRSGQTPHLHCFVTWAVRLCEAAHSAGIDLSGLKMMCGGEPLTPARRAILDRAGVAVVPLYGTDEVGGLIGHGCLSPETADDNHHYHDLNAVIHAGKTAPHQALPPDGILLTTLRRTASLILLNVSMGDRADLNQRRCGCPVESVGWPVHLQNIRSFEKLSLGGMTLLDSDVINILEQVLPGRFGGGPTDYQLLEQELDDGKSRLTVLINPTVGPVDESAVGACLLDAIGALDGGRRAAYLWQQAGMLRVSREEPRRTASGKVHHLNQERLPAAQTAVSI